MNYFYINPDILNFMRKLAIMSQDEIYGWLAGYQLDGVAHVINAFDCQNYIMRSYVNAIPDPLEVQKIGNLLPGGLGIVGIYHSHPYKSKLFHSHTDDETLIGLSKQLPKCVSLVTNGEDIHYYQMNEQFKLYEIEAKKWEPTIPEFVPISFNNTYTVNIEEELLGADNLHIKIYNKWKDLVDLKWSSFKLYKGEKEVPLSSNCKPYLKSKLDGDYLQLKSTDKEALTIDVTKDESKATQKKMIPFTMNLNCTDPIYITERNMTFDSIIDTIKTEIVDESLTAKLFACVIDSKKKEILVPYTYLINLYGYLVKCAYYPEKVRQSISENFPVNNNMQKLSKKNEDTMKRLKSNAETYASVKIEKDSKKKMLRFVENLIEFANFHEWNKNVVNDLTNIKNQLK